MKTIKKLLFLSVASLTLFACSDNDSETPSTVDTKAWTFAANMDSTVTPGDNFFMYCNGTWYKNFDLGSNYYWGFCGNESQAYINEYAKAMNSPIIAKFWADSTTIDQTTSTAVAALNKMMALTDNIQTQEDGWKVLAQLMEQGYTPMFRLEVSPQSRVYQALLNVGDTTTVISKSLLQAAGFTDSKAAETARLANRVMAKLAQSRPDVTLSRKYLDTHPEAQDRMRSLSSVKTRSTGYSMLDVIFSELGIDESQVLVFDDYDSFYQNAAAISAEEMKAFLQATIAKDYVYTSHEAIDAYNASASTKISLAGMMTSFYKKRMCYISSYDYATHTVSAAEKADMVSKCKELITVFKERINALDWMSSTTKAKAIVKLDKMIINAGYPDKWIDAGLPTLTGTSLTEDILQIRKANFDGLKYIVGKTAEEQSFNALILVDNINMKEDNACYIPSVNSINIFPIYLKKPYYSSDYSDAFNYSTLGSTVGHEMTHGFDTNGSQYDEAGDYKNWWTVADKMEYQAREQKLVDCYDLLEIMPDELPNVYADGEKTLGENTADLGGVLLGYQAYMEKLAKEGYSGDELVKQQKKYFQAYGEQWRAKYLAWVAVYLKKNDVHSLAKERVNGIVMNIDRWYELYNVKFGDNLYLPTDKRAYIW